MRACTPSDAVVDRYSMSLTSLASEIVLQAWRWQASSPTTHETSGLVILDKNMRVITCDAASLANMPMSPGGRVANAAGATAKYGEWAGRRTVGGLVEAANLLTAVNV
jgi:hypothetical protein